METTSADFVSHTITRKQKVASLVLGAFDELNKNHILSSELFDYVEKNQPSLLEGIKHKFKWFSYVLSCECRRNFLTRVSYGVYAKPAVKESEEMDSDVLVKELPRDEREKLLYQRIVSDPDGHQGFLFLALREYIAGLSDEHLNMHL